MILYADEDVYGSMLLISVYSGTCCGIQQMSFVTGSQNKFLRPTLMVLMVSDRICIFT